MNGNGTAQLPVIDISTLDQATGKEILDAFITHGFLYLTPRSTAFDQELLSSTFTLSKSLFSLPASTKQEYWIDTANRGYTGIGNERLDPENQKAGDKKEAWNWGEFDDEGKLQQGVPADAGGDGGAKEVEDRLKRFDEACRECCTRVLELLAMGLEIGDKAIGQDGLGKEWFSKRHTRPSGSIVRMLRYPPTAESTESMDEIGAGAHSDYGSITLLFQRVGERGLEIRTDDGSWKGVEVIPKGYDIEQNGGVPPIVVNVGDLLEYWTNGLLRSTVHRVKMPPEAKEDRYSMVYFCHPRDDEGLVAVPSELVRRGTKSFDADAKVGHGGGTGGHAITAKEHLLRRLAATYDNRKES